MKKTFLSNFILKVIAIITMTIDHIGTFMCLWAMENETLMQVGYGLQYIGRLAMPLFVLLAVEGALKTKNTGKYILRLSMIGVPIIIAQIIGEIITQTTDYNFSFPYGNIFITLILIVVMIFCFEHKKTWIKILGILPILISILSFIAQGFEYAHISENMMCWWFPYMLRPQYDIYGLFLGLSFYLAHKFIKVIYSVWGMNPDLYKDTENYQFGINALQVLGLVVVSLIHYALMYVIPSYIYWIPEIQIWAIAASLLILFYNGRRGYNEKWFKIFSYLYYPVHIVVIYIIFLLIFI